MRSPLPDPTEKARLVAESGVEDSANPLAADKRFGNYILMEVIGQGGNGIVWRSHQLKPDRIVALKMLLYGRAASTAEVTRLKQDGETAASLKHPNIVQIYEVGEVDGQPYFSMEHVEGSSLAALAAVRPLRPESAARYMKLVAEAAHTAHQRNILHRDLKPSNILLDLHDQPRVIDFGLARRMDSDSDLTLTGQGLGSLPYVSPEQVMGKRAKVTCSTDIYSMGATLYHLLTGRPPFVGDSEAAILGQVLHSDAIPLRKLNPSVPADLETICLKCIEKEPAGRYASAHALAEDLGRFLRDEPILAKPVGVIGKGRRWCRRKPAAAGLILACIAGISGLIVTQRSKSQALAQEQRSKTQALGRELDIRKAESMRGTLRVEIWRTNTQSLLRRAGGIKLDPEVIDGMAATLVGLDLKPIAHFPRVAGSSLAFDPAGRLAVGGRSNAPARLWDPAAPSQLITFNSLTNAGPVCFAPNGRVLQFVWLPPNRYVLRELETGIERRAFLLEGESAGLDDGEPLLAMSADGSRVAAAVRFPTLAAGKYIAWDTATGGVLCQSTGLFTALAITPDGGAVAAGDQEGKIEFNALRGVEPVRQFWNGSAAIHALTFGRDASAPGDDREDEPKSYLLAAGEDGGRITVYETRQGRVRSICLGSDHGITALAFHPEGTLLLSGGRYQLRVWNVPTGTGILRLDRWPADYPQGLAFSPDGRYLAAVNKPVWGGANLFVSELDTGQGIETLRGLGTLVSRVWWSDDGRRLAGLSHDWQLGIWDVASARLIRVLEAPKGGSADNAGVVFFPDGRRLACVTWTEARIYDIDSGRVERRIELPEGYSDWLRYENDKLYLLRREKGPGQARPGHWVIRDLFGSPAGTDILFQQSHTNWKAYYMTLPARGDRFYVCNKLDTNSGVKAAIHAYSLTNGTNLWSREVENGEVVLYCDHGGGVGGFDEDSGKFVWIDLVTGRLTGRIEPHHAAAVTHDMKWTANPGDGGCLLFGAGLNPKGLRLAMDWRMAHLPEFSPNGKQLAWGTVEGTVLVADIAEVMRQLKELRVE